MTSEPPIVELGDDDATIRAYVDFVLEHEPQMPGTTPESMRRWLDITRPSLSLGVYQADELVAAAMVCSAPHDPAGTVLPASIVVHPDYRSSRRRERLLARLIEWAQQRCDAPTLRVGVDEDDAEMRAFWIANDFEQSERYATLRLALPASTPAHDTAHILSLEERPDLLREAWQIQSETWADMPGDESAMPSFDHWSAAFDEGRRPRAASFVALDASGAVIGLTTTSISEGNLDVAYTTFTGVRVDARGQGVAFALKLRQVAWCTTAGYHSIETANHEDNAAMLKINERLGFQPHLGVLVLTRQLMERGT